MLTMCCPAATTRHLANLAALAVAGTMAAAPVALAAATAVTVSDAVRATVTQNAVLVSATAGQVLDAVGVGWGQPQQDGCRVPAMLAQHTDADLSYAEILSAVCD